MVVREDVAFVFEHDARTRIRSAVIAVGKDVDGAVVVQRDDVLGRDLSGRRRLGRCFYCGRLVIIATVIAAAVAIAAARTKRQCEQRQCCHAQTESSQEHNEKPSNMTPRFRSVRAGRRYSPLIAPCYGDKLTRDASSSRSNRLPVRWNAFCCAVRPIRVRRRLGQSCLARRGHRALDRIVRR